MNFPLATPIKAELGLKKHVFNLIPEYKTCIISKNNGIFGSTSNLTTSQKMVIGAIGLVAASVIIYDLIKKTKKNK